MNRSKAMLALAGLLLAAGSVAGHAAPPCTDDGNVTLDTMPILGLEGRYAFPDRPAHTLVVMAHGYRNRSDSWVPHLLSAAGEHDAIAVAMDYSGTGPAPDNRGWRVKEGAQDSIAAAKYFLANCPSLNKVAILGVSMGGNTSGLAVAAKEMRNGNRPLFDYWVSVEGAVASTETYLAARALAPSGDPYISGALADFEEACGGPIEAQPDCYREMNVVARSADVAASGVKGVAIVHGIADGLVPVNQSRELATVLRAQGVPTDFFSVARRNDWTNPATASTEGGTTADSQVIPRLGQPALDIRPLAGHGWEGSTTHIVIKTGFDRLWAMLEDGATPANDEYLVDSEAGTIKIG
jgi:hypothetical protein